MESWIPQFSSWLSPWRAETNRRINIHLDFFWALRNQTCSTLLPFPLYNLLKFDRTSKRLCTRLKWLKHFRTAGDLQQIRFHDLRSLPQDKLLGANGAKTNCAFVTTLWLGWSKSTCFNHFRPRRVMSDDVSVLDYVSRWEVFAKGLELLGNPMTDLTFEYLWWAFCIPNKTRNPCILARH